METVEGSLSSAMRDASDAVNQARSGTSAMTQLQEEAISHLTPPHPTLTPPHSTSFPILAISIPITTTAHCPCSLATTHYQLLTTHCHLVPTAHRPMCTAYCPLLSAPTHCPMSNAHRPWPLHSLLTTTAFASPPSTDYLPPTVCCAPAPYLLFRLRVTSIGKSPEAAGRRSHSS